ncbi:hypothetical protein PBI_SCTP2_293 [Salicola phage SCTP-2]|nr:hypothetical protein PBI_SCTP2_293 [Salicola phage SCTP-2]
MIEVFNKKVIVTELEHGESKTKGGIVVPDDDGKERGIRPRWCKVHKVGEKASDIKEGQWILVEHGRWSYRFKESYDNGEEDSFWYVDYDSILAVWDGEEKPEQN